MHKGNFGVHKSLQGPQSFPWLLTVAFDTNFRSSCNGGLLRHRRRRGQHILPLMSEVICEDQSTPFAALQGCEHAHVVRWCEDPASDSLTIPANTPQRRQGERTAAGKRLGAGGQRNGFQKYVSHAQYCRDSRHASIVASSMTLAGEGAGLVLPDRGCGRG